MIKNLTNFFIILTLFNLTLNKCAEGCLKCTKEDKCELCDTTQNFKINVDVCEKVTLENCTFINQAGECLSCSNGFYIESTSRKCIVVDKAIENCENYDSSQSCILCKTDFFLDGLVCAVVTKKIANCMYYILDEQCSVCNKGFLIDFDTKTCSETSSIANCSYFSRVKCENCSGGYIKNENYYFKDLFKFSSTAEKDVVLTMIRQSNTSGLMVEKVCEKTSLTNCAEYETFDKCKVCASGYYLGEEDKKCKQFPIPVISNCQRYSSNTNCILCANQYFLKNSSTCSAVTDIENCSEFDGTSSSTKCKLCKDEYYLSGSTTCKLRENKIDNCDKLNSNSDSCLICAENYQKTSDSLKCLPIVSDCKEYSSSTKTDTKLTCSVCKDSFLLDQAECKSGTISGCAKYTSASTFGSQTCEKCNNQFWLDINICKQIDTINGCLNYHGTKDKSCVQCEKGNFNFHIQKVCKTLIAILNCVTYTVGSNPLTCDTCISGYIPNEGKTACLKINVDNCSTGSSPTICTKCKDDYVLDKDTKCHPIFNHIGLNCQVSDINKSPKPSLINVKCSECKINSLPLNHKDIYVCVKKEELALNFSGTFADKNNCNKWKDDSNNSKCQSCIEGKFINSTDGGTCTDSCTGLVTRFDNDNRRNFCNAGSLGTCKMQAIVINSNDLNDLGCIECSPDSFMTTTYITPDYTNVAPKMGNDIIPHPRAMFIIDTCVAKTGATTFNTSALANKNDPISNCLVYTGNATNFNCIRCKDFHTGVIDKTKGYINSCSLDTDFDETKKYGLDLIWEKLFSNYSCKAPGTIPFVGYLTTITGSNPTPKEIRSVNPVAADRPTNGTLKKSNFCALTTSEPSMLENCGLGAYELNNDTGKDVTGALTFRCAACKPGYYPKTSLAGKTFIKTECEQIANCTGTDWFNSCSQCAAGHVYKFDSGEIDYKVCTPYVKNENCYSGLVGGDCKVCKKGFNLNKDKLCDSFTSPNCASSNSFSLDSGLSLTGNFNLKAYIFHKVQDGIGCSVCKAGYVNLMVKGDNFICTESEYIKTKSAEIVNANSKFIQYCESYSKYSGAGTDDYSCNKCKAGKLLVVSKNKCVTEITDCELGSDEDAKCNRCKVGYALKNFLCVKGAIDNCTSYPNSDNKSEVTCSSCAAGYFKELNETKCTQSLVNNCAIPSSLKKCSSCKTGYILYVQASFDYCYPLDSAFKCTAATIENSDEYGGSITCTGCELTHDILVTDPNDIPIKTICLAYQKTENCKTHSVGIKLDLSTYHCTECEEGFYLDLALQKCVERVNKPSDCLTYHLTEDKCQICSESTFEEDTGKKCTSFPVGIVGCNNYTSSSTCTGCMKDMFLSGKSCADVADDALIANCEFYQNGTTCKSCKENYLLSSNTCTKANVGNCIKLKSVDVCEICKNGYGLKETAGKTDCVSVNQSKCLSFTPKDPFPCLVCEEDYYPDSDGKCVKANPLISDCTLYKDNSTCITCKPGSSLSLDKKSCTKGNVSSYIPPSCIKSFISAPFCITCSPGHFIKNGDCTPCSANGAATGCFNCDPFNEEKCILCNTDWWMNKDGVCTAITKPAPVAPIEEESEFRIDVVFVFLLVLLFK